MRFLLKFKEQENGSITMTVIALMLFITSAILIAYFSLSNQSNDQSKKTRQISDSYKVTNSQIIQEYKDKQDELNAINSMSITEAKALSNYMTGKETNTQVTDESGNTFVVPAGFKVIDDANNVTEGIVIQDKDENEWVWIPVSSDELALMYEKNETGWTMYETSVKTKYKTKNRKDVRTDLVRTNPGIVTYPRYREPDVLSTNDIGQTYLEQAGFTDIVDMAINLNNDYKEMIDSVMENGGFYVGRYEVGQNNDSNKPQLKPEKVMSSKNWYELYYACKSFSNENVKSRMIWGCQWDQVCKFISDAKDSNGNTISLENSSAYGNYSNSTGEAATYSGESNFDNTAGRNEAWELKNIYDLAGNCYEFTQEACDESWRAIRGRFSFE